MIEADIMHLASLLVSNSRTHLSFRVFNDLEEGLMVTDLVIIGLSDFID